METLNRCNQKMVTILLWVNEMKESEKENGGTFWYNDLWNLSAFIGVVLQDIDRLFLEEQMGFLRNLALKDLQRNVNRAIRAYRNLL